jgi:RNA 2',3'-cyclic 3'-phosphodiesterase
MRLFIGLQPDRAARVALAHLAEALREKVPALYVPPELYHLTLAFLGNRDAESLPALNAALTTVAEICETFSLSRTGIGYFGRESNAILYAAFECGPALLALDDLLRLKLTCAGESFDPKPLVPHITLARKARLTDGIPTVSVSPICFEAKALTLFHSARIDGVLHYLPIMDIPLFAALN